MTTQLLPPPNRRMFPGASLVGFGECTTLRLEVARGEDVKEKILSFMQKQPFAFILNWDGYVSKITCKIQPSGEIITYEGCIHLQSLSIPYRLNHRYAFRNPTRTLYATFRCPDGSLRGGSVEGNMIALYNVEVVFGTYRTLYGESDEDEWWNSENETEESEEESEDSEEESEGSEE